MLNVPRGWYQNSSTLLGARCIACPRGFFNSDKGDNRIPEKHEGCEACDISTGLVAEDIGQLYCSACTIGKFTTIDPSTPCAECPAGWKGATIASKKNNDSVQSGDNLNMKICDVCEKGQFQQMSGSAFAFRASPAAHNTKVDNRNARNARKVASCPTLKVRSKHANRVRQVSTRTKQENLTASLVNPAGGAMK